MASARAVAGSTRDSPKASAHRLSNGCERSAIWGLGRGFAVRVAAVTAEQALAGVSRLLLDTNPAVYVLEGNPAFADATWAVLDTAQRLSVQLFISPLTLMEVMAKPGASAADLQRFAEFCLATEEIEFRPVPFDDVFSVRVANLR